MRLHLIIILIFITTFSAFGQSTSVGQNKPLDEIQRLNAQVVKLYGEKDFDGALVLAKTILDIASKENLSADERVLPAIRNLGEVYLAKGKESEAIASYQMVITTKPRLPIDRTDRF